DCICRANQEFCGRCSLTERVGAVHSLQVRNESGDSTFVRWECLNITYCDTVFCAAGLWRFFLRIGSLPKRASPPRRRSASLPRTGKAEVPRPQTPLSTFCSIRNSRSLLCCEPPRQWLSSRSMSEITRVLNAIERGDGQAAEQLLPLVYDELRKLA